jgi:hypothetical protein
MIILTHIGDALPSYLEDCLEQLRIFNPSIDIVILCNRANLDNETLKKYNIGSYPVEDLHTDNTNRFIGLFGRGNVNSHLGSIAYGSGDYWCVTATRLFYLHEYVRRFNISDFFHFENDVLIYEDLNILINKFKTLYSDKIAITRGGYNKVMTGFSYISSSDVLGYVLDYMCKTLSSNVHLLPSKYNIDMVNEMALLHIFQIDNPSIMCNLPILPSGSYSENFQNFESVFDPASYGQFVGGTPGNAISGVIKPPDHYIGQEMRTDLSMNVVFKELNGLKIPYLLYRDNVIKINNLHIHSKELKKYLSR